MNILYCGNNKVEDGLLISILSLLKNVREPLHIYVLTMHLDFAGKAYLPISDSLTAYLDGHVKKANPDNFVVRIDTTELFSGEMPTANLDTRFTPYCMLRLYADEISELPDKILYLDTDVVCQKNCVDFYYHNISDYEFVGVLDYYGRWFFRKNVLRSDYINSGVLLMNLQMIRKTGLLRKCRQLCAVKKMFMPDQSALNKLAVSKKAQPRRFNEQHGMRQDTVFQHFTTSFRFIPWFRVVTVKPWQVDEMHSKLKLHEYDELLSEYNRLLPEIKLSKTR